MYPYAADTDRLLPGGLRQVVTVSAVPATGGPIALSLVSGSVGWDERQVPRVTGEVTCHLPDAQSVLDALDPRTAVRLRVTAGYVRPGGATDAHLLADLAVVDRDVDRPADTLRLSLESDESRITGHAAAAAYTPAQASVDQAVRALLAQGLGYTPTITGALPDGAPEELLTVDVGGDYWRAIEDLADRVGGDVYDDGTRTWVLGVRPERVSVPAAILRTGRGGTVLRSSTTTSRYRSGWANAAVLTYRWNVSTGERIRYGRAAATGGPYAVGAVGRVTYTATREGVPTTDAQANAAAAALLPRLLARGRTVALTTVSRYWIRPGHTVTVRLPLGTEERYLVAAASYDLAAGTCDLDLRLPDTQTTITNGA